MSIETTRDTMTRFFKAEHSDSSMMADDVVFTLMATGEEQHGKDAVMGMMHYLYNVAFDAKAAPKVTVFGENSAVAEFDFIGKHIGDFNGIPATGKDVCVPLAVVYDIENGKIKRGRIYFETPMLLKQLGIIM